LRREILDGVPIDRVPLYPSHSRSVIGRIVNYISFAASLTVYGLFTRTRPDVLYAYHPPLTVGFAAAFVAAVRRISFVYDIQDMWPDSLAASGMFSYRTSLAIIGAICRCVYARADRIIVQSPGFKKLLIERGVPAAKIEVIYNWANELEAGVPKACDLSAFELGERFNIVYAGTIGPSQSLDTVLHAAKLIEDTDPNIQFILVGDGIEVERLRALATTIGVRSVRIRPRMPQSEIGNLLAAADVLLVHLRDEELFRITIPSKTQFYLAMGKPILMSVRGDAADLVERAQAGIVVKPQDQQALANAARKLAHLPAQELAAMGARGRKFYESQLSAAAGVKRTLAALDAAIASHHGNPVGKRAFDVVVAATALIVLAPVIFLIGAVLYSNLGRPTLFRQIRAGLDGKPFDLYKLRTMNDKRDTSGQLLPDRDRLSAVGRIVRQLSLDELPQLWNVLRGDMSLVGPRPLPIEYLDRYTPEQARRHQVRPGLTGWAQVNGRNAISWEQKLALDVWYVRNRSFVLDLKILAMTVMTVFSRRGITHSGHETMPEFRGTIGNVPEDADHTE